MDVERANSDADGLPMEAPASTPLRKREAVDLSVSGADPIPFSFLPFVTWRIMMGVLGIAFPIILPVGHKLLDGEWFEPSISHYYYTGMGSTFIGILFVVGIFLLTYRGFEPVDDISTNIAGACAPLIALFPTTPENPSRVEEIVGVLHFVFAATFLLTTAWISFFLFTKSKQLSEPGSDPPVDMAITPAMLSPTYQQAVLTSSKAARNAIYRWCGLIMFASVVLIGVCNALDVGNIWVWTPTFFFEAIAIWAFGVSWLTKSTRFRRAED